MKYKVGDVVLVREDLQLDKVYSMESGTPQYIVIRPMLSLRGCAVTIKKATEIAYRIEECDYFWTDDMFSGLASDDTESWGFDETAFKSLLFGTESEAIR